MNTSDILSQIRETTQKKLISGENIKTINGTSLLGSGNIDVTVTGFNYTGTDPVVVDNDTGTISLASNSLPTRVKTGTFSSDVSGSFFSTADPFNHFAHIVIHNNGRDGTFYLRFNDSQASADVQINNDCILVLDIDKISASYSIIKWEIIDGTTATSYHKTLYAPVSDIVMYYQLTDAWSDTEVNYTIYYN